MRLAPALSRVGRWSLAHGLIQLDEYLFDYLLYPFMLYRGGAAVAGMFGALTGAHDRPPALVGYWTGFAVLLLLSTAGNILYLWLYDRSRTDWFGFEEGKAAVRRIAAWRPARLARAPVKLAAFTYLSVWHSPLFAVLSVRPAGSFSMRGRDWAAFVAADVLANVAWTGVVTGAVSGLWPLIRAGLRL